MSEPAFCRLRRAVGDEEECPRGWCPFWDRDPVGGRCALERLGVDVGSDPVLARYLLDVRAKLERRRAIEHAREAIDSLDIVAPPDVSGA